MFEWRLLTKEKKDEIIKEYMKQDEEMDFKEYARRKRDIFFTDDDIELYLYDFDEKRVVEKEQQEELYKFVWEDLPKEQQLRLILMYIKQDKTNNFAVYLIKNKIKCNIRELYDYWYDGKQIREWQEEKYTKKEEQGIRLTKTGYETNKEEYKYGEFKDTIIEEEPKTAAKRVKLSEMSDAELKEYYKKKEEEKERRKRLQEEIKREEYEAECRELQAELDKMSYKEIEKKYKKVENIGKTWLRTERFVYYDQKGKEDEHKSAIIRKAYENRAEVKEYREKEAEAYKQNKIQRHKDAINENKAYLVFIIGIFVFMFMVATNFENVSSIIVGGIYCGFFIIVFSVVGKEENDRLKREIEEMETHKK